MQQQRRSQDFLKVPIAVVLSYQNQGSGGAAASC